MRLLTAVLILLALAAVAAWATRPGPEVLDAMLDAAVRERVATTDIEAGGEAIPTLALAACKLRPTDCVAVLRETMEVTVDRRLLTSRATVRGFGRETTCLGIYGRFFCRRPVAP